jgi:NTP pyrophosphatase (non-canonical NTP hydrolase)
VIDKDTKKSAAEATGLTFAEFSRINRQHCESPDAFNHALDSWSTSDWFTAMFGELGEAANAAKKLNRIRDSVGLKANRGVEAEELRAKLRQELGDGFVYLDLLAQSLGFTISEAAVDVFNAKSEELGCSIRIAARQEGQAQPSSAKLEPGHEVWVRATVTEVDTGTLPIRVKFGRRETHLWVEAEDVRPAAPDPLIGKLVEEVDATLIELAKQGIEASSLRSALTEYRKAQ